MWQQHRAMHQVPRHGGRRSLHRLMEIWWRYAAFHRAWRALRRSSKQARRQWLENKILEAQQAAERHDYRAVYAVVQAIAPKRRYEQVRIRGPQDQLLTKAQQMQAVHSYFEQAFAGHAPTLRGGRSLANLPDSLRGLFPAEFSAASPAAGHTASGHDGLYAHSSAKAQQA